MRKEWSGLGWRSEAGGSNSVVTTNDVDEGRNRRRAAFRQQCCPCVQVSSPWSGTSLPWSVIHAFFIEHNAQCVCWTEPSGVGYIITNVSCCEQKVQSGIDKSGHRPDTVRRWASFEYRSRFASSSSNRCSSKRSTADLHVERQIVLSVSLALVSEMTYYVSSGTLNSTNSTQLNSVSLARLSKLDGEMPHCVSVAFRQSLYCLYCPPGRREPWQSCP